MKKRIAKLVCRSMFHLILSLDCRQVLKKREPVYQALWAGPCDFDEVLISPVMIQDHMPDNMLKALNKVSQADSIFGQIKRSQTPVSRMSSVRPGNYELLEETTDYPDVSRDAQKLPGNRVLVNGQANHRERDSTQVQIATINVTETTGETIVVDVEVHERKDTQSGGR